MKSKNLGKNISIVEVLNVSLYGIWILVKDKEYFLPFIHYPWFKEAKINDIYQVKFLHKDHLYWENLDIDLDLNSLEYPEKFPLVYKLSKTAKSKQPSSGLKKTIINKKKLGKITKKIR
jgi:hypothetical protein